MKTKIIKFDELERLNEFYNKLSQTTILPKLAENPVNLFLSDIGKVFQNSLYILDDSKPDVLRGGKSKYIVGSIFDTTMDCCMLDARYDSIVDNEIVLELLQKDPDVYDKILADYSIIGTSLEKVIIDLYTQLVDYDIHNLLLDKRDPFSIEEDYTNHYITILDFTNKKKNPRYILDNKLFKKENKVEEYFQYDKYGYILWEKEEIPTIPKGTELYVILTNNKGNITKFENVFDWKVVKKFRILRLSN